MRGSFFIRGLGCANGMELDFSRFGTPTDNTFVQSFNGCLGQCFTVSIKDNA